MRKARHLHTSRHQKYAPLEERIYRLRCVEAWSIVVPWVGYRVSEFLSASSRRRKRVRGVRTLVDSEADAGPDRARAELAYIEGLRMDEAMQPLRLLGLASTARCLPNQNGRDSAGGAMEVRLQEHQVDRPRVVYRDRAVNTWKQQQASEYGF